MDLYRARPGFARSSKSTTPSGKSEVEHPAPRAARAERAHRRRLRHRALSHRAPAARSVADPARSPQRIMPGLGTHPLFAHALRIGRATTRALSPDYSRSGRFFEGALHSYNDVQTVRIAFGRFEGAAEQLCRRTAARASSSCRRRHLAVDREWRALGAVLPDADAGRLEPPAGAYQSYRFRDRHAMLLEGAVPLGGAQDGRRRRRLTRSGKVAPRVDGLDLRQHGAVDRRRASASHTKKSSLVTRGPRPRPRRVGFRLGVAPGS